MKRQGSSTGGQPPVNKPDASTDLRSKIGAKLQTLLNGLDTDSVLYAKRRKQLYDDLFGKPKYSEIIIDPTIVIKEEPDVEECSSDSSTLLNSQNFLLSAKSRLTELLNKQQDGGNKYKDSGKENALFSNRNKSSSSKSMILQSPSCSKSPSILYNSLNKKRISTSKEHTNSSSDSTNHEDPAKKLVIVLEDCMKSNIRTKSSRTKHAGSNIISSNVGSNFVRKQGKHLTLDNLVNKKDNIGGLRSTRQSKPCENTSECCFIEDNSEICRTKPAEFVLSTDTSSLKMGHDVLQSTAESISDIPYYDEDEMVDDPIIPQVIVDIKVGEVISADGNCNFEMENSDSDVELLCEKERTAEVITLEDNDYEIVKDREALGHKKGNAAAGSGFIHVCKQCGKSFRAFSLLKFHIKMHGKLSQSPSSSSQSFS